MLYFSKPCVKNPSLAHDSVNREEIFHVRRQYTSERPLENLRPLPLTVSLPLQYLTAVYRYTDIRPLCNGRYILTVITVTYRPHRYGR